MNAKELKDLIQFLIEKDISEFELERGDVKMRMKRGGPMAVPPVPGALPIAAVPGHPIASPADSTSSHSPAPAPTMASSSDTAESAELHTVRSPIVGSFYESPSPGAPAFVQVGDSVKAGQALCIIEAMKLMNEIESDASGVIVKRHVENGQPVEYGQTLFTIRVS